MSRSQAYARFDDRKGGGSGGGRRGGGGKEEEEEEEEEEVGRRRGMRSMGPKRKRKRKGVWQVNRSSSGASQGWNYSWKAAQAHSHPCQLADPCLSCAQAWACACAPCIGSVM